MNRVKMLRLLLFYLVIPWCTAQEGELQMFDKKDPRSRMMMVDGHMYFHAGFGKNITFIAPDPGTIWIGETDITDLPSIAAVDGLKELVESQSEALLLMKPRTDAMSRTLVAMANITKNLITVTRNISMDVKMLREWKKDKAVKDAKLRKYLNRVSKGIRLLIDALKSDPCDARPCEGGGTCIPRYGIKFFCLCPPHKTGQKCESDVDECAEYSDGAFGCQNNATCENIPNGFLCHCPKGFHGPLCQFEHGSCRKHPGLCGHGHCVEATEDDVADYRCICESGYQLSADKENPTCIDINECDKDPCHPGVDCINLPGSFMCSGCPKGLYGNGLQCADIDECAAATYPCSTNPRAPCINTYGSFMCGACPPGFRGDGKTCTRYSKCASKPCFPEANCTDDVDNLNAGGFLCHCPQGYLGDGIGLNGCKKGNSTVCQHGRCYNGGTCKAITEDSYLCICPKGYLGSQCEKASQCLSSPCKNGGTCQSSASTGYICLCAIGFYGQDCEHEEDACGQHFSTREGNFTYPSEDVPPNSRVCDYIIAPRADNEALRVWFTAFTGMDSSVAGPLDCQTTNGNVSLFDGDNDNANNFGTFCGSASSPKAPWIGAPITMTGARAMFRYKGTKGLFSIKWDLKKRECGYRTSVPGGALVIPSHYQNFTCEWFLSAKAEQVVELNIPPIKLGTTERNCSVNQLEVYDGYTAYDNHRVIHFCSNTNETVTVRSTGPFLSVFFTNDLLYGSKTTVSGFQMTYKFVEPEHKCGGEIINPDGGFDFSGEITSPNYGGFYPPDTHCVWKIDGIGKTDSSNQTNPPALKLEFDDFDIVSPFMLSFGDGRSINNFPVFQRALRNRRPLFRSLVKCIQDYLHVYADGVLLWDGCNSHRPPPSLLIPEGKAILQFRSDAKQMGKGFKIKYSVVCEKRLRGNGTIQTWNYPEGGAKGKCKYIISADATAAIVVKFKHIGLNGASVKECFYTREISEANQDYVLFSGGKEEDTFLNQKYICAKYPFVQEGEFTVSASRPLSIEYSSSGSVKNTGLLLEYHTIDVGCGGFFAAASGVISSPNYPNKYMPHMHCVYYISVPWTKVVRLTFDNFDLEVIGNDDCTYDRVEVYDKYSAPADITNPGKLLGKFCGSMLPPSILSSGYQMVVIFSSDRSISGNGFSARFDTADLSTHCDSTFTSPTGNIIFDTTKGRYTECNFHIALPFNSKIVLRFNEINIPCHIGKLQVRNGADLSSPGFPALWGQSEICDDHPAETPLRTHGNRAYLKLILLDTKGVSFNISYEQIISNCGGRITGVSGSIASPQYPQKDSRPMDCEWIVAVAPGNRVNFQLAMVDDLKSSDDNGFCGVLAANRLDVLDHPYGEAKVLRRYCRKILAADTVESDDHEIAVRYKQQGGIQFGALFGFLAHFNTDCRGIELTDLTGTIQSPGFPDPVYSNRFCTWTIKVPVGNRIKVVFHKFDITQQVVYNYRKAAGDCTTNWLKFNEDEVAEATVKYQGAETINKTQRLGETCNYKKPMIVMSNSNILHISFQSKMKKDNKFWLTWSTQGCGGHLLSPASITLNKNSFHGNITGAECYWKIQAPVGKKIAFKVTKFMIFRNVPLSTFNNECKWNDDTFTGLEAYAGLNNDSGYPQDTICNAVKDPSMQLTSHSNLMFVRLKWLLQMIQTESNGEFFTATIDFLDTKPNDKDDCGAVIDVPVNENRTIHSPRFPDEYPKDAYCEWIFKAAAGHHLSFLLKEYTTPNSHPLHETARIFSNSYSNLTCQHPIQFIEGALTILEGSTRTSRIKDRICLDIKEPMMIEVESNSSLVMFHGASSHRLHESGGEDKKRIGFVLEVSSTCGSLELATQEEQIIRLFDLPKTICNITIKKKNPNDSGIRIRLDEFNLKHAISKHHVPGTPRDYISDALSIQLDQQEPITRNIELQVLRNLKSPYNHEEFHAETEAKISVVRRTSLLAIQISIAFSTDIESCGTELQGRTGYVTTPPFTEDYECIWTLDNNPGNKVIFTVESIDLPESENCAESYVELRKNNDSGPLIERFCDVKSGTAKSISAEALWIKVRYIKPEQLDEQMEGLLDEGGGPRQHHLRFRYHQIGGGTLDTPGTIMQPKVNMGVHLQYDIKGPVGQGLLFHIKKANFPEYTPDMEVYLPAGLYFVDHNTGPYSVINKMRELANGGATRAVTGWHPPKEIYIPENQVTIYTVGLADQQYSYTLTWEPIELEDIPEQRENATAQADKKYDCGGHLSPSWEWQSLSSPIANATKEAGAYRTEPDYPPMSHCLWQLSRPQLTGIEIKVIKMDLEDVTNCVFDYLAIIAADESTDSEIDELEHAHKLCKKEDENQVYTYTYNKRLNIHFVTDRNRGGSGFEIQYRYTCNSFDFIKKEHGAFHVVLTSPGYPNTALRDNCGWAIVLESNRRIAITVEDLNLDPTRCKDTFVGVMEHGSLQSQYGPNRLFCGAEGESKNVTLKHGRLYLKYMDKDANHVKGFKIRIEEVLEECTVGELVVDELSPNMTFYTPLYPARLPNSLDCDYIARAPAGHRLQFTVDPQGFNMQVSIDEGCFCDSCDYLEIRDGPTEHSSLVGRFCGVTPPSTITSTGNFLFIRIKTDSYATSAPFKAEIRMATCGGTVILTPNQSTLLQSPNYPDVYPMEAQCEWTVIAPNSHFVEYSVNHMWLSWTVNCTTDKLVSYDGSLTDPVLMGPICSITRLPQLDYRTSSNRMTVQFVANSTVPKTSRAFCKDKKCGFELSLKVSEEGCGGLIDNNSGMLTTPGYPGTLLPHVKCKWDLRAGPGYRYLLDFEFTDKTRNGFYTQRYELRRGGQRSRACFMDLQIIDGKYNENRLGQYGSHYFCDQETVYVTEADIATLLYNDVSTKDQLRFNDNAVRDEYYVPFRLNYTRVPYIVDEYGCTFRITANMTLSMGTFKNSTAYTPETHYCHLWIMRPEGYGTTIIKIQNYTDFQPGYPRDCSEWGSYIELESNEDETRVISERFCNATFVTRKFGELKELYINKQIDVHVKTIANWNNSPGQMFNITVEFQPCGGIVDNPNFGVLTSPGFGERNYSPNENCVWQLRAPEGMVVWINITDMEIESHVECEGDQLRIGEGKDDTTIHLYCVSDQTRTNDTSFVLLDRFRTYRTHSRYLTLTWRTNGEIEMAGWRIEYEFVDEGEGCGFTTHAMTGVVHSPMFPKDYPNEEECLWDIQVPFGYQVQLTFTHFDIEASKGCANDFLQISEEHLARGNEPLGDYYFLYEDEEKKPPMCGIVTPAPYSSTSNRLRLNFTSNSQIQAKGFRAEWQAKCGGVYTLSHYQITSPHYPNFYPNENMECMYMIDPQGSRERSVVVLKIQDFDLSPVRTQYGRYPCESDYVEVIDVLNERTLQVFCGGDDNPEEAIAVKGAVGIRMITNQTFMHPKKKLHKGFAFSYSIRKCGGRIAMLRDDDFIYPISSPAFPLDYPHDLDCVWNLTTTGDRIFSIRFMTMEIEQTPGCDLDWLELHDGPVMTNTSMIGKYCGESKDMPKNYIRTQTNSMLIRFASDSSMSRGGFKIVVTATLGVAHGCGGKLAAAADWKQLTPPLNAQGKYFNNLQCGWTVTGDANSVIEFKLESINTEELVPVPGKKNEELECVDVLNIYDGFRAFSPILDGNLCTETAPASSLPMYFHSSHRVAHVSFETDSSGTEKQGFSLQYRAAPRECGQNIDAKSDIENFPFNFKLKKNARNGQTEQHCQWVIISTEQTPIHLSFKNISLASPDGDCSDSYIEIRDVGSIAKCEHPACAEHDNEKKFAKYCGQVPAAEYISNTMVVQVTAASVLQDDKQSSFSMGVQLLSACNRTINGQYSSGRITSPNYPKPYDHNATCITTIVAPEGQQIFLVFNEFRLEMGRPIFYNDVNETGIQLASRSRLTYRIPKCDHDWLQIYEKNLTETTKQYCGSGLPPAYMSNGSTVSVLLKTDYSVSSEGYDISYYTARYITAAKKWAFNYIYDSIGVLTNVGYPNGYNDSATMMWSIRPPSGLMCTFEFETISLAVGVSKEQCANTEEYVQVELRQTNEERIKNTQRVRSCSHTAPTKFTVDPAEDRRINFIFKTDSISTNNGIGFRVRWDCNSERPFY